MGKDHYRRLDVHCAQGFMVTVELLNDKSCEGHGSPFAVRWNYNRHVRRAN